MRLVLFNQIPEDANLRREWNDLVLRVEHPQVFYTYEWALAAHRAYKDRLPALLFLAYEAGHLCGIAALTSRSHSNEVCFLCASTADYCDFITPPEHRREFISLLLAELKTRGFTSITLANLPADSVSAAPMAEAASQNGYYLFARTGYECAQVALNRLERDQNKPVLRRARKINRCLNSMSREGPVRLEHRRSWDEIQPVLPEFMDAHVARFLASGRISNLARQERRVFLQELARLLTDRGWLNLTRMVRGDSAIAWNYGFQFHDTWFWYQPTFRVEIEKYSPGMCLLAKIIEEAARESAVTTIDLGLGAEEYKEVFANQTRRTLYLTLRASPVQHAREIVRYSAARGVKAYPPIEKGVRRVLVSWRRVTEMAQHQGVIPTLRRLAQRVLDLVWLETEVSFFTPDTAPRAKADRSRLAPVDLNLLAGAATQYANDEPTCAYLLRAARLGRQRSSETEAFALIDDDGTFLHFAWTAPFHGFYLSELNHTVEAPARDCVMLFDCWTPPAIRGRGHYGRAVSLIADLMLRRGKKPWIFSAAANAASIRGLVQAGFQRRFSLVRQRIFGWQRIKGQVPKLNETVREELSARL